MTPNPLPPPAIRLPVKTIWHDAEEKRGYVVDADGYMLSTSLDADKVNALANILNRSVELEAMLKSLEWAGESVNQDNQLEGSCCPVCRSIEAIEHHASDCVLAKLLSLEAK